MRFRIPCGSVPASAEQSSPVKIVQKGQKRRHRRGDIGQERRIQQKEETLDKKLEALEAKEEIHKSRTEYEKEVKEYLMRMLRKEVYDKKGLIYGIGHAVYTISDPRKIRM